MPMARPSDRCNPWTANTKRQRMMPMKIVAPIKTNEASSQPRLTPEMVFHKPTGPIVQLLHELVRQTTKLPQPSPSLQLGFTGENDVQNPRHQDEADGQFQREA